MSEPTEMALELERVVDVIIQAKFHVAGLDQADTARDAMLRPKQSPLRTRLEHAEKTAERIAEWLRESARRAATTPPPDGPPITRDGGPI